MSKFNNGDVTDVLDSFFIDYAIDDDDDETNIQELMQQRSDMNKAVNEWYAKAKAFDRIVKESKGTFSCGDFCDDVRHIINSYEIGVATDD